MKSYDVCVLGGGPAGYHAAVRAAQLGAEVVLVEERELGGLCLNRGCIPAKAFIHSVKLLSEVKRSESYGLKIGKVEADFSIIKHRAADIVNRLLSGLTEVIASYGIHTMQGHGEPLSRKDVRVSQRSGSKTTVDCKNLVLAMGSTPVKRWDVEGLISYDEFFLQGELPESAVILGANPVGLAMAHICNGLGVETTVLERVPQPLTGFDREISARLFHSLRRQGVKIVAGVEALKVTEEDGKCVLYLQNEEAIEAQRIVTAERTGNIGGLGLSELGVATKEGFIDVNERMETTAKGIYAAGDVTGSFSAQEAFHQGTVAAENIMGTGAVVSRLIPRCIYTTPEAASVGLTEEDARRSGYDFEIGRFPFSASGKALCLDESEGFVKIITDSRHGEILGVHMIGPSVTEMIGGACLAMNLEATLETVAEAVFPHPTLSEAFREAALASLGTSVHLRKRKR